MLASKKTANLRKCLGFAIGMQIIVSLLLFVITLLQPEAKVDSPLTRQSVTIPPHLTDIEVLGKPHLMLQSIVEQTSKLPDTRPSAIASSVMQPSVISKASPQTHQAIKNATKKQIPNFQDRKPIRIVQWTGGSGRGDGRIKCNIPCLHSPDKSDSSLAEAAAVVFHIPSYSGNARSALGDRAKQALTVALSMESSEYYRRQKDLSDYDLTITCSFDSDLPVSYYGWDYNLLLNVSDWPWERREKAIVFIAKNCHSRNRRETLVKLLQKYVRVDSISSCMNNHPWPPDIPRRNKDDVQKRYLMYLAAENSVEKDYVTEKVYGGLINGAVPLYLGAPNIEEFVPTHSVIPIPANFTEADVIRISEVVKKIFNNKTVYEEWIEFKKHPYEERFKRKMSVASTHIWCRLCRKIFAMQNGYGWDKELQEIIFDSDAH